MAHSTNIISSIKLPDNKVYEIHDAQAIHSAEELGLSAALVFKGTQTAVANLPTTGNKVGDVWHVTADDCEYVWTEDSTWEALGSLHDAASSDHTHSVAVTGTNSTSTVTGSVTVPTVSSTQKYLSAAGAAPDVSNTTDSVLGANTTFTVSGGGATTTKIKATANGVAVAGNGTAAAITGFGTHNTDAVLGIGTTFKATGGAASTSKMVTTTVKNPSVSAVSIPNVTANESVTASKVKTNGTKTDGTSASWTASVDSNGVLSFSWTANTPTAVTLPTFESVSATNTTLGTALSASKVTTSDVVVATGSLNANGNGDSVATGVGAISVSVDNVDEVAAITGLGTPTTAQALTGVQVTSQPTVTLSTGATGDVTVATGINTISVAANNNDNVNAITGVEVGAPAITLTNNSSSVTGSVPVVSGVTIGSASASLTNGVAAAQTWTQADGSTGVPQ